jgi:hypothetical protein
VKEVTRSLSIRLFKALTMTAGCNILNLLRASARNGFCRRAVSARIPPVLHALSPECTPINILLIRIC